MFNDFVFQPCIDLWPCNINLGRLASISKLCKTNLYQVGNAHTPELHLQTLHHSQNGLADCRHIEACADLEVAVGIRQLQHVMRGVVMVAL